MLDDDKSYWKIKQGTRDSKSMFLHKILNSVVRVGSTEESFKQSLEGGEGVSLMNMGRWGWGEDIPGYK